MNKLYVIVLVIMLSGCAANSYLDVPLTWKPTNDIYDSETTTLSGVYSHKFKIMAFSDLRENKKEIAKNIEKSPEKVVTTRDDVAEWCGSRFSTIVKQHGFNVVENDASIIITGDIIRFYVTEDSVYKADIGIKMTAKNATGKVLWQGMMIGKATRFGRSYKLENYYETLSDAYINAVNGLLKNQDFKLALQKQTPQL